MPDLTELVPARGKADPKCRQRSRRAAVEEGETVVGLDEITADAAAVALVQEVDRRVEHHRLKVSDQGERC
jgi:hypothetical protein